VDVKRTLLAMALLLTSVFGVTGCGSDDDEAPVESRIKNSINCPSGSAKLGPNDSFGSLTKGICYTPIEASEDEAFMDDMEIDPYAPVASGNNDKRSPAIIGPDLDVDGGQSG